MQPVLRRGGGVGWGGAIGRWRGVAGRGGTLRDGAGRGGAGRGHRGGEVEGVLPDTRRGHAKTAAISTRTCRRADKLCAWPRLSG
jgi:hypothetical protein